MDLSEVQLSSTDANDVIPEEITSNASGDNGEVIYLSEDQMLTPDMIGKTVIVDSSFSGAGGGIPKLGGSSGGGSSDAGGGGEFKVTPEMIQAGATVVGALAGLFGGGKKKKKAAAAAARAAAAAKANAARAQGDAQYKALLAQIAAKQAAPPKKSNVGIIIGASVGAVALIGMVIFLATRGKK